MSRLAALVHTLPTVASLIDPGYIRAEVEVKWDGREVARDFPKVERYFTFKIDGYGYGGGFAQVLPAIYEDDDDSEASILAIHIGQYSAKGVSYSDFYSHKHGNDSLMQILFPFLEAKLLPALKSIL